MTIKPSTEIFTVNYRLSDHIYLIVVVMKINKYFYENLTLTLTASISLTNTQTQAQMLQTLVFFIAFEHNFPYHQPLSNTQTVYNFVEAKTNLAQSGKITNSYQKKKNVKPSNNNNKNYY